MRARPLFVTLLLAAAPIAATGFACGSTSTVVYGFDAGTPDAASTDGGVSDGATDAIVDAPLATDGGSPFPDATPFDPDAAPFDAGPPPFALRPTSYIEGAKLPCDFVATYCGGQNRSPAFTWSQVPAGTQSFALVFHDETIDTNHWVLYDIPANVTTLAEAVQRGTRTPAAPAGAFQTQPPAPFGDPTFGYFGPCPGAGATIHDYTFTLYAEPVAHLAGMTAASTVDQVAQAAADAPVDSAVSRTRVSRTDAVPGGACSTGG
jgi:Raf kinase inhibitor-like YbhB/YbcL family protein